MSAIVRRLVRRGAFSRALVAGVILLAAGAGVYGDETREVFSAAALSTGGPQRAVAGRLTFSIERWTTAEQAQKIADTLRKGGAKAMLEELRDQKEVGKISEPGSIGYPLQYAAQETRPDGSRHIVLMTDRPMSFAEVWAQPITVDYPITYVELQVDKDGKGTGKMSIATKLIPTAKLIVVEDWAVAPIQLTDVKKQS